MSETQYATQADLSAVRNMVFTLQSGLATALRRLDEKPQAVTGGRSAPIDPGDRPADELIDYTQFVHMFGDHPLRRNTVEKYGMSPAFHYRFCAGHRPSPLAPVLWRAGDVAKFFADRAAGQAVSK